ncbi:phosphate signaling complex protein PhoU [Halopseudomonas sp.]|uniref:phosphate signaling complex protein PhoU n=1 Tax=Halopseudomonas sp. TaxID=2901191 RepID=UPI001A54EB0F|nr:phosphate signaling complex protein PhoU [Pseudomonas sp.]
MREDNEAFGQHISTQFNEELADVRTQILEMGGLVEQQITDAITALTEADGKLGEQVRANDERVNQMERRIDEECMRILALRHPAAGDLRLVMCIAKVVVDLERIGDEASKIAKRALLLVDEGQAPRGYVECRHIGNHVRQMVQDALGAFARMDGEQAYLVAREDKVVDKEYKSAMREMVTYMMEDPRSISRVLNILWVLRSLERVGDHARNVAEQVIFLVKGTDVRYIGLQRMEEEVKKI